MLRVIYWPRVKPRSLVRMERRSSAGRLLPSLRYDTLIHQPNDGLVFSVTAARGGDPVFLHYPRAGRLFVSYHHERADVLHQFKEQIGNRWIWRTDIGTERSLWDRDPAYFVDCQKGSASAIRANTVECLMKLFRDSAEKLISSCSGSDSGIIPW